jgi:hypothetical protein
MTQQQIHRQVIEAIRSLTEATKAIPPSIPVSPSFVHTPEVVAVRELDRQARERTRAALAAVRQFAGA